MDKPITLAVIGAGIRGTALARKAAALGARIGAVAEPDAGRREGFAAEFHVPRAYAAWEQLVQDGPPCQAAILATLDNQHTGPALACLERGWHLLLEKPMADTLEDCAAIASAQERTGAVLAVCHTLRHLPVYTTMKRWVEEGRIGRPVHLEHMEAIGHVRYAHNYVRGRWGREAANTFLLLHKCCHDLDLIAWLMGSPCRQVASFGSLQFFRPEHAPAGSAPRCLGCGLAERCVHSALRLYVEGDLEGWPARDVCGEHTREAHLEAIRTGPYGACAWRAGQRRGGSPDGAHGLRGRRHRHLRHDRLLRHQRTPDPPPGHRGRAFPRRGLRLDDPAALRRGRAPAVRVSAFPGLPPRGRGHRRGLAPGHRRPPQRPRGRGCPGGPAHPCHRLRRRALPEGGKDRGAGPPRRPGGSPFGRIRIPSAGDRSPGAVHSSGRTNLQRWDQGRVDECRPSRGPWRSGSCP